jgi:MFS family permease
MADQATDEPATLPAALAEPTAAVRRGWIAGLGLASLGMWMAAYTPLQVLLPEQLQHITPRHKIVALAIVSGFGALAAGLATPVVGALSDRTTHRFALGRLRGRRHRWTLGMALLGAACLALLAGQRTVLGITLLWVAFNAFQNGQYASLSAAIPDHVPVQQRATVAGWVGMPQALGLVVGTVLVVDVLANQIGPGYLALALLLAALALPFVLATPDHPLPYTGPRRPAGSAGDAGTVLPDARVVRGARADGIGRGQPEGSAAGPGTVPPHARGRGARADGIGLPGGRGPTRWTQLAASYWVSPRRYPDFAWAWITRFLASLAIAMGTLYLLYFLRDAVHYARLHPGHTAADGLLILIVIYTGGVVVTAIVGGMISDRLGRRKMIVTVSGALMAAAALLLTFDETWPAAIGAAVLFGVGFGAYLAVDQALITQVLPAASDRAKDLGVINIAIVCPSAIGALVAAPLVSLGGYPTLFAGTAAVAAAGAILVWRIKSVP